MLQVHNLSKRFGGEDLFTGVSFALNSRSRVAIFGRNGSGKSTIFRIILGEESSTTGDVRMPNGYVVGALNQHLTFTGATALEEVASVLPPEEEYRAEIILEGLGLNEERINQPLDTLSGGYQLRVSLARTLVSEPNLLLLDEPTNYLDIPAIRWLVTFLRAWPGEVMVISHDRSFVDRVVTHSMLLHRGKLWQVEGQSEKLYARVAEEEERYERTRQNIERKRSEMQRFVDRFKAKASKATQAQSRVKALEKLELGETLREESSLDFSFKTAPWTGKILAEVRNISFAYPGGQELLSDQSVTLRPGERLGVIGKNGLGKSTLLRILAKDLAPTEGELWLSAHTRVGYFGQTNIDRLNTNLTIIDEIGSANIQMAPQRARDIAGLMMFEGDEQLKKVKILSGGERSRVLLGKLLAAPSNLLLLDEPDHHLDVESVDALGDALENFGGSVVLVTHNEALLTQLADRLIVFGPNGPEFFDGGYEQFLREKGWDDSGPVKPKKAAKNKGDDSKSARKERAQDREVKMKLLKPTERRVGELEKSIANYEGNILELEKLIVSAAEKKDGAAVTKHSQTLAEHRTQLVRILEEWESAAAELEQIRGSLTEG